MLPKILLIFFFHYAFASWTQQCPIDCKCLLDEPVGRKQVNCSKGGLEGPLDLKDVDPSTEVLIYTAPEYSFNSLMIGPIFDKLKELQEIHITRSNIPNLGEHPFYRLKKLEVLDLRENKITEIYHFNFGGIDNLKKLFLDDNKIETITSGTFRNLTNLEILSLSNNRIQNMSASIFENLKKLRELNLNGNRLTALNPEAFRDIPTLKVLQCRNCGLRTINNDVFQYIQDLQLLDLGENKFKEIVPNDFNDLPHLYTLLLDQNRISELPSNVFAHQTELKELNLAKNEITSISKTSLNNLSKLKELNLARNHIKYIDNFAFKNLTKLVGLNLAYNKLKALDKNDFEPFGRSLERLDVGGNIIPISHVKGCLINLRRLEHLVLQRMDLEDLPEGIFNFNKNLFSLNLSGNRLTYIPIAALAPVPELKKLDLSKNKLTGLVSGINWVEDELTRIKEIDEINFEGNPWICDQCRMPLKIVDRMPSNFLQVVCKQPYGKRLEDIYQRLPFSPCASITGENLILLREGRLELIAAICGLMLLCITFFLILAAVCYQKRHARHYYTNEEKRDLENDPICDTSPELTFIDSGEISFKFPLDDKISISIIDDIKKDPIQNNGT